MTPCIIKISRWQNTVPGTGTTDTIVFLPFLSVVVTPRCIDNYLQHKSSCCRIKKIDVSRGLSSNECEDCLSYS
ncbi:hypothetical protein BRADI_3g17033v3 [Brachypodium distachyon]|uniref:Uncharacterized protein n=1 Tax=Brachypodium distachyon TaxID=15368 RepID=A0A0Q3LSG2_BRADI|nr:hypothetical protein BRADI_3g17033v3 [Brachypodium distachyon]